MGISGNLLKEFVSIRKEVELKKLSGKTIAIDVSNELYRAVTGMSSVHQLTDFEGKPTSHILVMLQNALKFKKLNIRQIFVFDNPTSTYKEKLSTLEKRKAVKLIAKEKINNVLIPVDVIAPIIAPITLINAPNPEIDSEINPEMNSEIVIQDEDDNLVNLVDIVNIIDLNTPVNIIEPPKILNIITDSDTKNINKWSKAAFTPTAEMYDDIKFMLTHLNIEWIQLDTNLTAAETEQNCAAEAEQICAYLTKINVADYVLSADIDSFLFGATNVIRREPTTKTNRKGETVKGTPGFFSYNLNEMLLYKQITMDDLIYIGIALGTDFSLPIKGIGVKTAFKNPANIRKHLDKSHERAYEIFTSNCDIMQNYQFIKNDPKYTGYDKQNLTILLDWLITKKRFGQTSPPINSIKSLLN